MAPYHILIVIISSVIPENLVLLTKSEQSGPKSAHIRPTNRGGSHVAVSISYFLALFSVAVQFQPIFVSYVAISAVLCGSFKAMMSLVGILP